MDSSLRAALILSSQESIRNNLQSGKYHLEQTNGQPYLVNGNYKVVCIFNEEVSEIDCTAASVKLAQNFYMELPEATKSLASRTTTPLDSFSKERKTPTLSARERLSSSKAHDTLPNEELCRNLQALFLNTEGGAFFNDERRAITSFDEQRFFQPDSSGKFTSSGNVI
ncbi:hypothetical protein [Endozoicomonas atrinae]|uniref:hypothetical protein n=1 Tax=Endozoicomonas atrinae TaxID=1333660 RepID=UPI000825D97C|nr:hypothetical protein [Endozoicomonas atrinae]